MPVASFAVVMMAAGIVSVATTDAAAPIPDGGEIHLPG
jgi:hypothetical protein